jgi:hypothetical protein
LLVEDDGALCCARPTPLLSQWCFVLLAVPDGLTAEQVVGELRRDVSLKPPMESGGSLCGLWIELGLFD